MLSESRNHKKHMVGIKDDHIIQFGRKLVMEHRGNPEEELAASVLLIAMCDFLIGRYITKRTQGLNRKTLYSEAAEWFSSNRTDHAFSFVNICLHLKLDPNRLRDLLLTVGEPPWQPHLG